MWVPREKVPKDVRNALQRHQGKFFGMKFVFHISKTGNVTRYWKDRKSVESLRSSKR
jgi:hypothetical protein